MTAVAGTISHGAILAALVQRIISTAFREIFSLCGIAGTLTDGIEAIMYSRAGLFIVASTVLVCGALAGCGEARMTPIHTVARVQNTITIDTSVGETFAPPPEGASPAMTAQQAWATYTKVDTSYSTSEIPSNVSVSLGLLTLPLGPSGPNGTEAYTARDVLTYGFSWHNCPVSRNPRAPSPQSNPCIEWNFINADTGQQIDDTWQQ
jgi:hypothetical protein